MIQLNGIRYRYPGGKWILKGINLFIKDGEYVVVCGASGSGKSTLGYLFNGLIPHFFGGTLKGSVSVNHAYTHEMSVADLFSDMG
ncbi:MAG: ATP-binding cassette domain-containing protein, partial [Deltaproteobacteria bacterium]|nr:ATP-binding cassette domain-containing protein [Deltaproteobacteria bacterium]